LSGIEMPNSKNSQTPLLPKTQVNQFWAKRGPKKEVNCLKKIPKRILGFGNSKTGIGRLAQTKGGRKLYRTPFKP